MPHFVPTLQILTCLQAFITSLKAPSGDAPLFELVRCYDSTQVDRAFADLLIENQRRVCFVLPGRATFTHATEGWKLRVEKTQQFSLILCDTDRETGRDALLGGPDNIGVIGLADIVADALAGQTFNLPFVALSPVEGDDLLVYDETKPTDSGRKGWLLLIETAAGTRHVSRQPLRR
jgi:hypothetical protein